jgi:hypothetical protein
VKAGSIIPMGPFMQYATEKPADTLELRVYRGADGQFTLYEDENDNYNYEQGQYSVIPITYHDSSRQLIIGTRQGTFTAMSPNRIFNVIWVDTGKGIGINSPSKFDTVIHYNGSDIGITSVPVFSSVPNQTNLQQNYPNPFNTSTKISFSIQRTNHVSLKIYDLLGREVAVIVNQQKDPGSYTVEWNAANFSSGVYLYRIQAGDFVKTKPLILLK